MSKNCYKFLFCFLHSFAICLFAKMEKEKTRLFFYESIQEKKKKIVWSKMFYKRNVFVVRKFTQNNSFTYFLFEYKQECMSRSTRVLNK